MQPCDQQVVHLLLRENFPDLGSDFRKSHLFGSAGLEFWHKFVAVIAFDAAGINLNAGTKVRVDRSYLVYLSCHFVAEVAFL